MGSFKRDEEGETFLEVAKMEEKHSLKRFFQMENARRAIYKDQLVECEHSNKNNPLQLAMVLMTFDG